MNMINQVRKKNPLIHHITNQVVMNFSANGLLAFGGSPIMAKERKEMSEIAEIADGILINIGTVFENEFKSMQIAGLKANERNIPVVLDPVGVGASKFRSDFVQSLLHDISFTAIKGNAGEMAHLVDVSWKTKGVESDDGSVKKLEEIATKVADKYNTLAIVTGEIDVLSYQGEKKLNDSGHKYLTKITGAGCLLGSIVTAILTLDEPILKTASKAVHYYGLCAERAANKVEVTGPGTFIPYFMDELEARNNNEKE